MRLLVVDDHPINVGMLRAQLEAAGHAVLEAADGVAALEVLERASVDGVVSDILMPRMDGYRLCMEIRARPHLADLPFVLCTSTYDSVSDRELAQAAGADAYLRKPARIDAILDAMRAAGTGLRPRRDEATERALDAPVLQQYSQALVRKLEAKGRELERANLALRQAQELAGLAYLATAADGRVENLSDTLPHLFALAPDAVPRTLDDWWERAHPEDRPRLREAFAAAAPEEGADFDYRLRVGEGWRHVRHRMRARQGAEGVAGWFHTLQDVTESRQAEGKIRSLNRVLAVLSAINAVIVRVSDRNELLAEACRIPVELGSFSLAWIGTSQAGGLGCLESRQAEPFADAGLGARLLDADDDAIAPVRLAAEEGRAIVLTPAESTTLRAALGLAEEPFPSAVAALPVKLGTGQPGVMVLHAGGENAFDDAEMILLCELAGDISFAFDHLQKVQELHYVAHYHPITALPNRRLFTERLAQVLLEGGDDMGPLAVALLDLERFRHVNESHGRAAGDQLLKQVAARLRATGLPAAHVGTDVFAVKIRDRRSASDVARALEELARDCFATPFDLGEGELRLGCRAGVAVHPDDGTDAETLLRNAEAALRRAKSTAQQVVFYAPEQNASASAALALESRLRRAIERREFILHYQPKIAFKDRRICGVEALIRWQDPERGLVPPGSFIPTLEESGLIGEVGQWALEQALADQRRWREMGLAPPRVAVNVSPLQLRRDSFADAVLELAAASPPGSLELEITESLIMDNVERNIEMLKRLRDAGVTIAIDDFGTGYCSLAYIARLPVLALKIDRSFVVGMTQSPEGMSLVSSIIALAHALGLQVVAEGVETQEQAHLLKLLACEQAQGYLFSRPVPADRIAELLRAGVALPVPVEG